MDFSNIEVETFGAFRGRRWADVAKFVKEKRLVGATQDDYKLITQNPKALPVLQKFPLIGTFYGFFDLIDEENEWVKCIRRNPEDVSPGVFRLDHRWLPDCRALLRK